ncbi:ureidoglycolate lyase, partial [Acinetobacter baumannii]
RPWFPPIRLRVMERHPLGSQAFVPMCGDPFLVVVAPPGPAPAPADLRAFVTNGRQGVNYARGTWHHPLLALDRISDFLVVDRGGDGRNLDE